MLMDCGQPFTTGICQYQDDLAGGPTDNSKLFIEVKIGALAVPVFAMVDTGAPYCVFDTELLDALGYSFDRENMIPLSTRQGLIWGTVHRITLTLVANQGQSLEVDSTFFVPELWKGNYIGFMGCLQRLRFAVDPGNNLFHFGKYP